MSDRKIPLSNPPMITQLEIERSTAVRARELPPNLQPLERLAWNYWWSWAPDGAETFRDLDEDVWEQTEHNPRAQLAQASDLRVAERAADPSYAERVRQLAARFDSYLSDTRSSPNLHLAGSITAAAPVAYFCAEYGIHSSLPLYSGGLGILAGDHLKSASDLNMPLIAVGLFYRFGSFHQSLRSDGWQEESCPESDSGALPLRGVNDEEGRPLRIEVTMRGRAVRARVWRADIGRVRLYLLDTNVAENEETDRLVTGHLYGGDRETRMVQEKMLGIGGGRLLRRREHAPG